MNHVELQILLVLSRQPCHGYELMKEISRSTDGEIEPGPGTLYVALRRLVDSRQIRELDQRAHAGTRRCYRITQSGRSALRGELDRLAQLLRRAEEAGWWNNLVRNP